jgi:mRNA interferase MazF
VGSRACRWPPRRAVREHLSPRRGEVWWVDFDPIVGHEQAGRRPALVVSADGLNTSPAGLVTVLPITTRLRPLPSRIIVNPPEGGLSQPSQIITEQTRTVSQQRLQKRIGAVSPTTMQAVSKVLRLLLGL